MANPYKRLLDLVAGPAEMIGRVESTDGVTSVISLPGGGVLTVRGTAPVGVDVYHRGGAIEDTAAPMDGTDIEV